MSKFLSFFTSRRRIPLTISSEVDREIVRLAQRQGISKTEAMRRTLSLVKIANQAHNDGNAIGLIEETATGYQVSARITGI